MTQLNLIKMHGCGNDYLFVDCFSQLRPADPGALAQRLSPRHTGVGADGLVLMCPASDAEADAEMLIYNADGSAGQMCGNALRCFAMWLHQSGLTGSTVRIRMARRLIEGTIVNSCASTSTADVEVNLGPPDATTLRLTENDNFSIHQFVTACHLKEVHIGGRPVVAHCLSVGNPHAVLFVKDLADCEFGQLGPLIEKDRRFPDRTNVEFVTLLATDAIRVRVWERGSGATLACGSGACAATAAGIVMGHLRDNLPVRVDMDGGSLFVTRNKDGHLLLRGPAEEIATISVSV